MKAWTGPDRKVTVLTGTPVGKVVSRRDPPSTVMFDWDIYADRTHDMTDFRAHWLELDYLQTLDHTGTKLQRDMLAGRMPAQRSGRRDWVRFLLSLLNRHPDDVATFRRLHAAMWKEHEDAGVKNMRASVPDMDPILVAVNYIEAWRAQAETAKVASLERMMNYGLSGEIIERSHWEVLDLSASPSAWCSPTNRSIARRPSGTGAILSRFRSAPSTCSGRALACDVYARSIPRRRNGLSEAPTQPF